MFLIFKPPQSYLQVQLLDPDGFKKSFDTLYEEQYAAAILKARQKRKKSTRKQIEFKKQIQKLIQAGQDDNQITTDLVLQEAMQLSQQRLADELKLDIIQSAHATQLVYKYIKELEEDIRAMVVATIQALNRKEERKQKREQARIKANKIKVLLLLTTMDDEYDS